MSAETQAAGPLHEETATNANTRNSPRRRVNPFVLGAVVLALVLAGIGWYLYSSRYEDTDDAQVDGHLNPVSARIDGTITAVHVEDNQSVSAGEPLVELDPRDNQVALDQARAQYDQEVAQLGAAHPDLPITRISTKTDVVSQQAAVTSAQAALDAAGHDLDTARARLRESQALLARNQADFHRYQVLFEKDEVARADYDRYKATAEAQVQTVAANAAALASAQQTVQQRRAQLAEQQAKLQETRASAPFKIAIREQNIASDQASAEAAQAALEKARLHLAYGHVLAPVSGVVTERSAEVGAHVSAGQQLLIIVQTSDLWVTADFKETQLAHMHPGQHVRIYVDALSQTFAGTVQSMPAVTGSMTSVLPPENATGNYVKVIQRMPVRIRFEPGQKDLDKLRPGMSVEPTVYVN